MRDARGMTLTTSNRSAADCYDAAVLEFASFTDDPVVTLDKALEADPNFAEALAAKAALFCTTSEQPLEAETVALVAAIEGQGSAAGETARRHAAAAKTWISGDWHKANALWGSLAMDHPQDLVAVQTAHLTDFLLGQNQMLRDRIAAVLPAWSEDMPGYSYLYGMRAFGEEESGRYAEAEASGLRALEMQPRDPWAVHAVTHVMEMQGRTADGIAHLRGREGDWAPDSFLAYHVWWHLALFHLDRGDTEEALKLYDSGVHPRHTEVAMEMLDAASLLWRLRLMDVEVGARWKDPLTLYEAQAEDGYYAFNDMHAMMTFLGSERFDLAERLVATMERRAAKGGSNGMMARDAGLPTVRGLLAFARGDYETAVEHLELARPAAHRFGGSHAQRDVIAWTATEAALRGNLSPRAQGLLAERLAAKPQSPTILRQQARLYRMTGRTAEAERTDSQASNLAATLAA
ncbi:tetratricopeptide repeat protein [Algihabitans albus]|uniref:tetratricopeptide repeat protein n=1 Tax=Algihabitans albus TaxID=2164067 RepID=UPI000E5C7FA1|nr:tetratricopeptide repeat protein [Algihabitans albus]